MLLKPDTSRLLMVDVQERLLPAMTDPDRVIANGAVLMRAARELGVPVTASEQYPKGLGPTVAALRPETPALAKTEFSCLANPALAAEIDDPVRPQLVVFGMEAHVCVLQTVADARAAGRAVYVIADATASRRPESHALAMARMAALGAQVVTTEMVVFEWLGQAGTPAFRSLSALIR